MLEIKKKITFLKMINKPIIFNALDGQGKMKILVGQDDRETFSTNNFPLP